MLNHRAIRTTMSADGKTVTAQAWLQKATYNRDLPPHEPISMEFHLGKLATVSAGWSDLIIETPLTLDMAQELFLVTGAMLEIARPGHRMELISDLEEEEVLHTDCDSEL